jgi:glutaconate CoA-transferase subunit A
VAGLRAAAFGIPFQPVAGMFGSDVPAASGLVAVRDPYTGQEVYVVPRLQPDWAVLHVQEADAQGNARIYGSVFWDRIMSRAARGVILSAERIVTRAELAERPELTVIPALLVRAVVEAPGGAGPCSCTPAYDLDRAGVEAYLRACADPDALAAYLAGEDQALRGLTPAGTLDDAVPDGGMASRGAHGVASAPRAGSGP